MSNAVRHGCSYFEASDPTRKLHESPILFIILFVAMWILPLVGYIGALLGFAFLTLAIGIVADSSSMKQGECDC
jgi:hypothetical protein